MGAPFNKAQPGAGFSSLVPRVLAGFLAFLVFFSGVARAGLFDFTVEDEKELGRKYYAIIRARLPLVEDPEILGYVRDMVDRVAKNMSAQPFPLTVNVIRDNSMNAFAAPAGYVFVFTGLILNLNHESELAAVVAHELAHVSQRHLSAKMDSMKYYTIAQLAGMVAGALLGAATNNPEAGSVVAMGSQAATAQTYLNYSRADEHEADDVGMNYLTAAGYNPGGMTGAFTTMRRMKFLKGGGDIPTYLSTHPGISERIAYLEDRIKKMPAAAKARKDDDSRFLRVQTLIRARYTDPSIALGYYAKKGDDLTCLDKLGQAIALSRTQRFSLAAKPFEEALACSGDDPLFLREAGLYALKVRQFAKAETLLRKAFDKNPTDLESRREYADLLAQNGDYRQALQLMSPVMLNESENPDTHAAYARMLGASGDLFGAHLHLAYAALYRMDKKQLEFQLEKAKDLASTPEQRRELAKLEKLNESREELLGKLF